MTVPTFANLGTSAAPDINSDTDASSYANASWTPPTSGLIVVFVYHRATTATTPTISGNSLTWTQIASHRDAGGNWRITLFGANASGSSTGATTVDFGGQTQLFCRASFFQVTDADLTGGVAAAFVQTVTGEGSAATSLSLTLSAAGHADNRPISGFAHSQNQGKTPRTNWTELDDVTGSFPNASVETQYRSDAFETTASATWTTSATAVGIAAEIKGASGGGPATVEGAAVISGTGSLSGTSLVNVQASGALSGTGALASAALVEAQGSTALSGTGTLAGAGLVDVQAAAALSGSSTLAAAGSVEVFASAALSASGALDATAVMTVLAEAALSGVGVLSAAGDASSIPTVYGAALLSGSSTLTGAALLDVQAAASLDGASTLAADAFLTIQSAAALAGLGNLQSSAYLTAIGAAALSGLGSLTAAGVIGEIAIPITPDDRIYSIAAEPRAYIVPAEYRLFTVAAESRTARA
jgi:hypothetical protein